MLKSPRAIVALAAACLVAAAAPAAAKSAKEVFKAAQDRYEKSIASIDNVTVVQDVMGVEVTTRMEKEMVDGRPMMVPEAVGRSGDFGSMYRHFDDMAKGATLKGSEKVDGHACYIVHVKDIEGLKVSEDDGSNFESADGTLYFDEKDYIIRRMIVNGHANRDGKKQPILMEIDMQDYRDVKGWMQPYTTVMRMSGEGGVSKEEMAKMKQAMADMEEQLAQMPPEQREMVQKMMKDKMPQMAEGDGGMTVTVTVKDVKVNTPAEE